MWKDITGFEGRYEISEDGTVRNKRKLNIITPKLNKYGYHEIGLRRLNDRKKYWFRIHRLVFEHYSSSVISGYEIDHIDNNKLNNHITNLRTVTSIENNLNRKLTAWITNRTGELYISKYKNGYMIRINRKDYKKQQWFNDLASAILQRDIFLTEIRALSR